jgi:hypothetical protein
VPELANPIALCHSRAALEPLGAQCEIPDPLAALDQSGNLP